MLMYVSYDTYVPNLVEVQSVRAMICLLYSCMAVQVYVLGSATKSSSTQVIDTLKKMQSKYDRIVLLLDPDVAGRQARNDIHREIKDCWHAFVPCLQATAKAATKYKDEGDVGIEHSSQRDIARAIFTSRKGVDSVKYFDREQLISLRLIAPLHERVRVNAS